MITKPYIYVLGLFFLLIDPFVGQAQTRQSPSSPQSPATRASAPLDPAEIRRQAIEIAQIRALLDDPDPNVRLLAISRIAQSENLVHRQLALDVGLSSAEAVIQEVALRALFQQIRSIVLKFTDENEVPQAERTRWPAEMTLTIENYEFSTGKIEGQFTRFCTSTSDERQLVGQLVGQQLSLQSRNGACSVNLQWDANHRKFVGSGSYVVNNIRFTRPVEWKPA